MVLYCYKQGCDERQRVTHSSCSSLSSVLYVISCDEKWWSKLGEATESLQKINGKLCIVGRAAAEPVAGVRCSAAGVGESGASPGTEGPCPRCVSAQGGSVSVATVASENGFRKQQADCQLLSADQSRAQKRGAD
ncbi:hypothetical protein ABVT39_021913 [Epinephelus coioides]